MLNWDKFFQGFSCQIGSFTIDKKRIAKADDIYRRTNEDIENAWKTVGKAVTETLKSYG